MKRIFSKNKNQQRQIRHSRVRTRINGSATKPRLSVFRSLKAVNLQLINDEDGQTLCSVCTQEIKLDKKPKAGDRTGKIAQAYICGQLLAEKAKAKKISQVVFDRGGYKYHGRVKAIADGARDGGLKF
ncbi:MAG: 50S ribosomal protein L18 [bacterium]